MADHVYKPSEIPKGQRFQYFWDYYKIPVLVGVLILIAVVYFLKTVVFAPKTDVSILIASREYVDYEVTEQIAEKMRALPYDLDGDGKVEVSIDYIHLDPEAQQQDPEYYNAQKMKLVAILSTAETALQIVDEETYQYLEAEELIGTYGELSEDYGHAPDEAIKIPLSSFALFNQYNEQLPQGLFFTLRPKDAMQLGDSEKKLAVYMHQVAVLEDLMQMQ